LNLFEVGKRIRRSAYGRAFLVSILKYDSVFPVGNVLKSSKSATQATLLDKRYISANFQHTTVTKFYKKSMKHNQRHNMDLKKLMVGKLILVRAIINECN
jgi:hypothetical protein